MTSLHTQTQQLLRRMLAHLKAGTSDRADEEMREGVDAILDTQRWQRECQQFFRDTPQVVGLAGELAEPGSLKLCTVMGTPLLLTRTREGGQLRAFINACRHRGACLKAGQGNRRLICPFHGWSYSLDGQLVGRPQDDAFTTDSSQLDLIPLAVSDAGGLLTVGLTPDVTQEQVDAFIAPIAAELEPHGFDRMHPVASKSLTVDAHWKLVANLSHESYHFNSLHRQSLAPMMSHHAVVDFFGDHSRWAFPLKGIDELAKQPESEWPEHFPGAINHTFFPGTVLVVNPGDAQIIRVEPGDHPGHSRIEYSGFCADPARKDSSREAWAFGGAIFEDEDLHAAELCQQGIQAGQQDLLIGRNEPVVQFWHRLWREKLIAQTE